MTLSLDSNSVTLVIIHLPLHLFHREWQSSTRLCTCQGKSLDYFLVDFATAKGAQCATTMTDPLLTVSQTATELGITRQAVQQLIDSKRLSAFWMLQRWAIPAAEVSKYKREKRRRSTKQSNGNGH